MSASDLTSQQCLALKQQIIGWGRELGFQQIGVAHPKLEQDAIHLQNWLDKGYQGTMRFMTTHGHKRTQPTELVAGTVCVITARMNNLPAEASPPEALVNQSEVANIARYALGRDYHRVLRQRLQKLASRIETAIGAFGYRVFADSAPVLEKALARNGGLGWIGKNTLLLNKEAGSYFFLGEIFTDLALPVDQTVADHCGTCQKCLDICPTQAIVAPYQLDARRCIAYLTIEYKGSIPLELRPLMGNRVFGCDDCQWICPWNKFAQTSHEPDFAPRHGLDTPALIKLFAWSEAEYLRFTEGSALRRIGYPGWLRNLAVALGNAPTSPEIIDCLQKRRHDPSELVREHVMWALENHI
jgi:epoxyqueuosine reductase